MPQGHTVGRLRWQRIEELRAAGLLVEIAHPDDPANIPRCSICPAGCAWWAWHSDPARSPLCSECAAFRAGQEAARAEAIVNRSSVPSGFRYKAAPCGHAACDRFERCQLFRTIGDVDDEIRRRGLAAPFGLTTSADRGDATCSDADRSPAGDLRAFVGRRVSSVGETLLRERIVEHVGELLPELDRAWDDLLAEAERQKGAYPHDAATVKECRRLRDADLAGVFSAVGGAL